MRNFMMMLDFASAPPETVCGQGVESVKRGGDSCPQLGQISKFVLGLSEEEEATEMVAHIRGCERCRSFVNIVSEVIETL
jgi:hypothetical protein